MSATRQSLHQVGETSTGQQLSLELVRRRLLVHGAERTGRERRRVGRLGSRRYRARVARRTSCNLSSSSLFGLLGLSSAQGEDAHELSVLVLLVVHHVAAVVMPFVVVVVVVAVVVLAVRLVVVRPMGVLITSFSAALSAVRSSSSRRPAGGALCRTPGSSSTGPTSLRWSKVRVAL